MDSFFWAASNIYLNKFNHNIRQLKNTVFNKRYQTGSKFELFTKPLYKHRSLK